jgi:hypothetical protein
MFLDAARESVKNYNEDLGTAPARSLVYSKWADWPPSQISHHQQMCCDVAREWIVATDYSELNGASPATGPRWVRQRFPWGASSFPIYWCEAVRKEKLDCGAHAAIAYELFKARGVPVLRAQLVQRFSTISTFQWENSWNPDAGPLAWTDDDLIYHEGCAIFTGDEDVKIWDSSAGWWVDSRAVEGYGSLAAVRLTGGAELPRLLKWGKHRLQPDEWAQLAAS